MPAENLSEQLTKYLTDVHSIEQQALAQMRQAPKIAGHPDLSRIYAQHLTETEEHERLVRGQLERRDAEPSKVKDAAGRAGGWGMILFARRSAAAARMPRAPCARRSGRASRACPACPG